MLICLVGKWLPREIDVKKLNIVFVILIVICGWLVFRWWRVQRRCLKHLAEIPGPFALPLIGNLAQVNVDHDELFSRIVGMRLMWGTRDGINKAWLGQKPYVFLSKACTVEPIIASSRHVDKSYDYQFLQPWLGTGLLTSSGAKWRSRRKILTPTFHFNILEGFVQVFGEQTEVLVRKMGAELGKPSFNVFPYVTLCTLDIICETAMGQRISAQSHSDSDYVRAVYDIGSIIQTRQASLFYQSNIFFRFSSLYKKHQQCIRTLHDFSNKVITERRKEILENAEDADRNEVTKRLAFLDLLIKVSENGSVLSDTDIREEVDTFMFEGHDTTSSAVCWTLYLLGCHPEFQHKVFNELDSIFSEGIYDRRPTLRDLKGMKYLDKCIKEALRLYPSVPILGRKVSKDIQIGKYTVPKGTTALVVLPVLHRDPEVFQNPEKYDPERFSYENTIGRHPYAYIPFSAGPRNCIGQKFALLEEKVLISGVLRKYRLEATERREDITTTAELVIRAKNGLHIRIHPRFT
ncbi:PREDICTED: cytochrome P450 4c3 [Ceratosolen solmsi marchali]|uniref:Cytochrome P450 4c3 n=1 Tax=Ceratosolen solmsi marchali TaxID=326594 RepID=A0AAJ7DYR0_9HYME|nr:PREDICTED: cytochrome P450 4c3 [Ceratosolen solmsi marchali]